MGTNGQLTNSVTLSTVILFVFVIKVRLVVSSVFSATRHPGGQLHPHFWKYTAMATCKF